MSTLPVSLVTGASKGIGRAIALRLAARGDIVVATARSSDLLHSLAAEAKGLAGHIIPCPADFTRDSDVAIAVATAKEAGALRLIVHSAGNTKRGDFFSLTQDDFFSGFDLKFHGAVRLIRESWPLLSANGGHAILIAGVGGRTPTPDFAIGASVNAAVMALAKALALRGTAENVRVNLINPGNIETDRLSGRLDAVMAEKHVARDEAKRLITAEQKTIGIGTPDQIAACVAYLDSPEGGFFHSALIDMDGGATKGL